MVDATAANFPLALLARMMASMASCQGRVSPVSTRGKSSTSKTASKRAPLMTVLKQRSSSSGLPQMEVL